MRASWSYFAKMAAPVSWGDWRAQPSDEVKPYQALYAPEHQIRPPKPHDIKLPGLDGGTPTADSLGSYLGKRENSLWEHDPVGVLWNKLSGRRVGIKPGIRPGSGPLADENTYSENGKFWDVTLPGGRTTTIYLRDNGNGTPNLAVPSEGWTSEEAKDLAAILHSSEETARKDGTVAGAPIGQTVKEIVSHDVMNRGWIDNIKNHRWTALAGMTGHKAVNGLKHMYNLAAMKANMDRQMLGMSPDIKKMHVESKPAEAADIRAPASEKWLHNGVYERQLDDEEKRRRENASISPSWPIDKAVR